MKPRKSTYITILDRKWRVKFHTSSEYVKKVADDSKAQIDYDLRTLDIDLAHSSYELIAHELGHCYAKERSLTETQLTLDQVEDFFCEIIGKHGKQINKQAEHLLKMGRALKK